MIQFSYEEFCTWFAAQRGGKRILDGLDRDQANYLHDICNAFKDEVDIENAQLEHELDLRRAKQWALDQVRSEQSKQRPAAPDAGTVPVVVYQIDGE